MKKLSALVVVLLFTLSAYSQREHGVRPTETGGPLMFEQAVFDVQSYDIALKADPRDKSLVGTTSMIARAVIPTNVIVLDLDLPYTISKLTDGRVDLKYERRGGKVWIWFPMTKQPNEEFRTVISYSGTPRVAPNPPWIGGFMWAKTPSGADWISVALQNDGADLLFPCKDHPSDKPESAIMRLTVPDPLVAVGPGRLEGVSKDQGFSTYTWRMSEPIPNYSLVFDAAPYRLIKDSVKSITGETIPIEFYILPESYEKGPRLIEETKKYNVFYEKYLGPFPWRSQKLGIVETPHLGMEHSTHLAYGNKFQYNEHGYDWLQLHEFGHEWWANLVTASDWRDFWIHEGFQSFMDTLYLEHLGKKDAYFEAMKVRAKATRNMQPVAPREPMVSYKVYLQEPDFIKSDGDIYGKGAVVLHTLRYLIGDDAFFRALRRMAYPRKEMESMTGGRQQRLVNTDDFLTIAEEESKMDLDWFFEMYLRQPKLPKLVSTINPGRIEFYWETPNNLPFPMPFDIVGNGKTVRLNATNEKQIYRVDSVSDAPPTIVIDPNGWVLRAQ